MLCLCIDDSRPIVSLTIYKCLPLQETKLQDFCDFLQHQRRIKLVHCDLLYYHRGRLDGGTGAKDPKSQPPSTFLFDSLFVDDEIYIGETKPDSDNESDDTKTVITRLLSKVTRIKLLAIAERVRYQSREKEMKLVFLQYKKILREYNAAILMTVGGEKGNKTKITDPTSSDQTVSTEATTITSMSPPGPLGTDSEEEDSSEHDETCKKVTLELHKPHPPKEEALDDTETRAKVNRLEEDLKAAQLKVEQVSQDVQATKKRAEDAQKEQKEQECNLRILLSQHKELKEEILASQEFQKDGKCVRTVSSGTSFDNSTLTSICESSSASAEARDEKTLTRSPKIQYDDTVGRYLKLKHDHDLTIDKLAILEKELGEKKKEAELTKRKLNAREEELRDVIERYKELHNEYNGLKNQSSDAEQSVEDPFEKTLAKGGDRAKLLQERDAARWKVMKLEDELSAAKESANDTLAKLALAKQHLRDVIFQYKTLEHEHSSLINKVEGLRGSLPLTKEPAGAPRSTNARRVQILEDQRDYGLEDLHSRRLPVMKHGDSYGTLQLSNRQGGDDQSIASQSTFGSHMTSQSRKKKSFAKEFYKHVKHTVKNKKSRQEILSLKMS